jgi:hypothetical protein
LALILLKHFCLQAEEHNFDRKTKHFIDDFLRENLNVALEFATNVLASVQGPEQARLPKECY